MDVDQLLKKVEVLTRGALASSRSQTITCPCCTSICQRGRLKHHILTHIDFPYKCSACAMYFKNKEEETAHRQEKHQRTFECKLCGSAYIHAIGLKTHMKLKHEILKVKDKWNCSICNKVFATKYRLKVHTAVHSEIRPFNCEHCGTSFKRLHALKTHITNIHEGIPRKTYTKMLTCEFCGAELNGSSVLKDHILVKHTENAVFKYRCEMCEKSFPRAQRLESHMNKEHFNRKPYVCNYCSKGFYILVHCKQHQERCGKRNMDKTDSSKKSDELNIPVSVDNAETNIGPIYGSAMTSLNEVS